MTILTVALRYLRGRLVASALSAVSIALGVSLVVASVLLARGIKEGFIEGATDYSLIVGAKGSPTQLVLSVVFRMDTATPNILCATYRSSAQAIRASKSPCRSRIGDAYRRVSLRGHQQRLLRGLPVAPQDASRWRRAGSFADDRARASRPTRRCSAPRRAAGRACGLGDRFYEGEEMAEYPLTVVGILRADAERRRSRDLPLAAELLGDERSRPEDGD